MVREVILDMSNINFKGNTLDVGINNYGIIYNILKQTESEISVDYYVENFNGEYRNQYDNGVLFFSLSQLHKNEVEDVVKNIWSNVRFGGNLYIWDREKQKKETVNDKVKVLMTGNKEKEFEFIDNSISNEFTVDSSKKILEKYFENPAITTDIIVGFPGETEEDFLETMDVVGKVGYDSAFTFIYSKRSGTPAAAKEDQVPEEVVKDRFDRLLAQVQEIARERSSRFEGTVQEVLVESVNDQDASLVTGRMGNNLLVHFPGDASMIGTFKQIHLDVCKGFYYMGTPAE